MHKVIVYSCITGAIDDIKNTQNVTDADFVMFSDVPRESRIWTVKPVVKIFSDPRRTARFYKAISHELFPQYEYSIWIDGSIELRSSAMFLIENFLKGYDMAVLKHPDRNCVYDEAQACIDKKKDDPSVITLQMSRYEKDGMPRRNGLGETKIVIRKNTPEVSKFNEKWLYEMVTYSLRDQLSFNYLTWKYKMNVNYMPDWKDNQSIKYIKHNE